MEIRGGKGEGLHMGTKEKDPPIRIIKITIGPRHSEEDPRLESNSQSEYENFKPH